MLLQKTGSFKFGQVERPGLSYVFKIFMPRDICNLRKQRTLMTSPREERGQKCPHWWRVTTLMGNTSDWLIIALSRFKVMGRHQYRIWDLDAFSSDVISWCHEKSAVFSRKEISPSTLGARDFSSAVSGFCQVFIVTRVTRGFGQRPTLKIPAADEKKLWYPG